MSGGKLLLAMVTLMAGGCASASPSQSLPSGAAGITAWREAREQVDELRRRYAAQGAYRMNVSLELTQLQLGQRMRARGAVAVRPPHSLRMILLGPGGTTALDLWVCGDAFRFEVPAISLERRGDANTPPQQLRGLPVRFLRWWFLEPLGGRLLAFADEEPGRRFVFRDGPEVVHLLAPTGAPLRAERRSSVDVEKLLVRGLGGCGEVHYDQRSTGLDITVQCEAVTPGSPPEAAFADPDDPSRPCGQDGDAPS